MVIKVLFFIKYIFKINLNIYMSLEQLFNSIKKVSKKINENNLKVDGLSFWQPIKKILGDEDIYAQKWIKQNKTLSNYAMNNIAEYEIFGNGEKKILEHNHFIIQTFRIPLNEKPSLKKIGQIALNIGQCQGKGTKFNKLLKNRTKLIAYISEKDIRDLSAKISPNTIEKLEKYLSKF